MTDLERKQSQLIYNLRYEKEQLKNENNVLKHELHELQTFKDHAEFILSENMYEQIEEEAEKHLVKEKFLK